MADEYNLVDQLPEGAVPLGFVASVKALDPNGEQYLYNLKHGDLMPWEAIGMLTSALDDQRDRLRNGVVHLDSDDDGDDQL